MLETALGVGERLEVAALERAVGGVGGCGPVECGCAFSQDSPGCIGLPPLPPDNCRANGSGGAGVPVGAAISHPSVSGPGMPAADLGSPNARLQSGIATPAARVSIGANESSQTITKFDVSVPLVGGLSLDFMRTYENPFGRSRGVFTVTGTHNNNIGESWTHSLNVTIRPIAADFSKVAYFNEYGQNHNFNRDSTTGGIDVYEDRGIRIERDQTTGEFTLYKPSGIVYDFGDAPGVVFSVARLQAIRDTTGNEITLTYDDPVTGVGKLIRVDAPAGDDRYLEITWNARDLISKVVLKTATTTLKTVEYFYDATKDWLVQVTEDNETVSVYYEYTEVTLATETGLYISKITDKRLAGYLFSLEYVSGGDDAKKMTIDFPLGLQTIYDRDPSTGITTVENLDGVTLLGKTQYVPTTYDGHFKNLRFYTDATNYEEWTHTYDTNERDLLEVLSPISSSPYVEYTYTAEARLATARLGNLTTDPTYTWTYPAGELYPTSKTMPTGEVTQYAYDANDRVSSVIAPEHSGTLGVRYTYDADGNVATITDPLNKVTTFVTDGFGNLTSITDPLTNVTTMEYDDFGRRTKVTDPNNHSTQYVYSGSGCGTCGSMGNLIQLIDAENNTTDFEYDENDNRVKATDPMAIATDFVYDAQNRQTKTIFPSGSTNETTTTYNKLSQVASVQDPNSNVSSYTYDHMGRHTQITDPVSSVTNTYDSFGNLATVKDGNNHTWTYAYDQYNRLESVTDPISRVTVYTYDLLGRTTKVGADALGDFDPTEYIYDTTTGLLDEVKFTSGVDVKSATYGYDGAGRLTQILDWIDNVNGIQYAYDDSGRLTSLTDYDGTVLSYTYDGAGNVLSMNDYHGNVTSYTYTSRDSLDTLTAPGGKVWDWTYNANQRPTQYTHPNGMLTEYAYDLSDGALTNIDHKDGTTVVQGFAYTYDDNGNITSITHDDLSSWTYTYDGRNRLGDAVRKDDLGVTEYTEDYTYDAGDNMSTKAVTVAGQSAVTTTYTSNNANELTSMSDGSATTNFTYDDWGRQTAKTEGTYSAAYAYHYGSKMKSVTSDFPSEGNVTYEYGADGKRRERVSGAEYTWYNWDIGFTVVSEEDNVGALTKSYVNQGGGVTRPSVGSLSANVPIVQAPVGVLVAEVLGSNPATGTARYYTQDYLTSTRSAYDAAKSLIGEIEYTPYGEDYANTLPTNLTHRYTGLDFDIVTGKYFAPYRYYDPVQARWNTRDLLGMVDGPNVYTFVRASALTLRDALGLAAASDADYKPCEITGPKGCMDCCEEKHNKAIKKNPGNAKAGTCLKNCLVFCMVDPDADGPDAADFWKSCMGKKKKNCL